MSSLIGALPEQATKDMHPAPTELNRASMVPSNVPFGYAAQPMSSFAGPTPTNASGYGTYSPQYAAPFLPGATAGQTYAPPPAGQQSHSGGPGANQPIYTGQQYFPPQQPSAYMYYPGPYGPPGAQSQHAVQAHQGTFPASYSRPFGYPYGHATLSHQGAEAKTITGQFPSQSGRGANSVVPYRFHSGGSLLRPGSLPGKMVRSFTRRFSLTCSPSTAVRRGSSGASKAAIPSSPRGPPRKPKQSGHAFWVGNLPAGAHVTDLKDHFSREATNTIESVFLISKSNCAFVNYRTEAACVAAMNRFHDSRFQGVRLVCRLRSSTSPSPGVPTGPAALLPAVAQSQTAFEAIAQNREISSRAEQLAQAESSRKGGSAPRAVDKYFIMKSLTVEDMELSIRNNIWATQAHNEEALNKAYEVSLRRVGIGLDCAKDSQTVANVYLIFSANKSGEYFGVARMASPINEEAAASLDWTPPAGAVLDDPGLPRSIPTPATECAPKGRIIDDSARGTIFWEADPEDEGRAPVIDGEVENDEGSKKDEEAAAAEAEDVATSAENTSFGKPFKIEWVSTNRLPFYRTRGLRNPWNAHREVKIARDGTELETSVGRRLVQMFQRSEAIPGSVMSPTREKV